MNDSSELNDVLESVLLLFLKTLYDFNPYLRNPDEQERLIEMPTSLKKVLREIISSEIFTKLILINETKKAEEKAREKAQRKEERKRQLIEGIKSIKLQDEKFDEPGRQFHSLETTFLVFKENPQINMEVVPEFYFIPEFFLNLNHCFYGNFMKNGTCFLINNRAQARIKTVDNR